MTIADPYGFQPSYSPVEMVNSQADSFATGESGYDYGGSVPPPPPPGSPMVEQAPYSIRGMGMSRVPMPVRKACGMLCVFFAASLGAYMAQKKKRRRIGKAAMGGGVGLVIAMAATPLVQRAMPGRTVIGKMGVGLAGGYAAGKWITK